MNQQPPDSKMEAAGSSKIVSHLRRHQPSWSLQSCVQIVICTQTPALINFKHHKTGQRITKTSSGVLCEENNCTHTFYGDFKKNEIVYSMFINYFRLIFIKCSLMKTHCNKVRIKGRTSIPGALNFKVKAQQFCLNHNLLR